MRTDAWRAHPRRHRHRRPVDGARPLGARLRDRLRARAPRRSSRPRTPSTAVGAPHPHRRRRAARVPAAPRPARARRVGSWPARSGATAWRATPWPPGARGVAAYRRCAGSAPAGWRGSSSSAISSAAWSLARDAARLSPDAWTPPVHGDADTPARGASGARGAAPAPCAHPRTAPVAGRSPRACSSTPSPWAA